MTTLSPGATIAFRKTLTVAEQAMFTGISGNLGGLYVDARRAKAEGAEGMVAFELIIGALVSTCLNRLAGPSHRIAAIDFAFAGPVPVGGTVEASATFEGAEGGALRFAIAAQLDGAGEVMRGQAVMRPLADV